MNQLLFNHNGVQVNETDLIIHGKPYKLNDISSFRIDESKTLSSLGVLVMFVGLLLLVEEGSFFVLGGVLMFGGVLMRFAHDPAYALFITISNVEKSVYVSKDILLLNKISKALETAKAGNLNQSQSFRPPFETSLS